MSNDTQIPLLNDLIRTGEEIKKDSESSDNSSDDLEIDFLSEDELSSFEHSGTIPQQSMPDEPPIDETPLYEAIRNEAFAKLETPGESSLEDQLPEDLHIEDLNPTPHITPELGLDNTVASDSYPEADIKVPDEPQSDLSNVRELLLDEEIHLILDKYMEQAYQEITQLIKKRSQ